MADIVFWAFAVVITVGIVAGLVTNSPLFLELTEKIRTEIKVHRARSEGFV
jgi:hypothetical protein|tara:strand:+ start:30 stop:182 length:153 start_codon:yes stop_codon:yes gene_type:complete